MSESERIGLFVIMSASSFVSDNLYEIVCIDCYFCNVTMQEAWFVRTIEMKRYSVFSYMLQLYELMICVIPYHDQISI